jgi:hypothetical protein
MFVRIRQFFDPLRLHCLLNIVGDFFVVLSGMAYGNPLRAGSAITGSSAHLLGIAFSKRHFFNIAVSDLVMGVVCLCGLLYFLSGTNLLGFESTPRYGEMVGGLCIAIAALCIISQHNRMATLLFTASTTAMSFSAFEVLIVRGEGDWLILMASLMFYSAGFVAVLIKKREQVKETL